MNEKLKEVKELVSFGLSIGMAIDSSLADDGKITFADAGKLLAPLIKAPAAFTGADKALVELKALDDEGKKELNEFVKAEFKIQDEKLEEVIEECVSVGVSIAKVVALVAKKKEEVAAPVA